MKFGFHCKYCHGAIEAKDSWIGQETECPYCGKMISILPDSTPNSKVSPNSQNGKERQAMKEYKVLTQKDKWFSGKFDPDLLEQAINAYAEQGWRVVTAATASFPSLLNGNRDEMVIIMERDK